MTLKTYALLFGLAVASEPVEYRLLETGRECPDGAQKVVLSNNMHRSNPLACAALAATDPRCDGVYFELRKDKTQCRCNKIGTTCTQNADTNTLLYELTGEFKPTNCDELMNAAGTLTDADGLYTVYPFDEYTPLTVRCRFDQAGAAMSIPVDEQNNYSHFARQRLRDGWKCSDTRMQQDWNRAGRTSFNELFLNTADDGRLYIVAEEFDHAGTFTSAQMARNDDGALYRENIPVGRAGDCYSWSSCAAARKGDFKIDLTGTGFAVDESVTWSGRGWGNGNKMVNFARQSNGQIISANCGAWCGHCESDGLIFLTAHAFSKRTCQDLLDEDSTLTDGSYTVYPFGEDAPKTVYCRFAHGQAITSIRVDQETNFSKVAKERLHGHAGHRCSSNWMQQDYAAAGYTKFSEYFLMTADDGRLYIEAEEFDFPETFTSEQWARDDDGVSYRKNIPVGYAGDCYSWSSCEQARKGEFQIDLTGTGFAVDDSVTWIGRGWGTGQKMVNFARESGGQIVSANCGAWCGSCAPEGRIFLKSGGTRRLE